MTQQQFERNRRFFQSIRLDNRRTMLTGKVQDDGSVTLQGAPTNKTWVRDTGDSRRSVPAWGNIPTANVPVIVDINPEGELEIVGVNWTVGNPMFGGALQGVAAPAIQGDVQALNVSAQNITIGRLQPSGAGGLNVQAVGFHTPDGFWRGGTISATAQGGLDQTGNDLDLAPNVPGTADQVRWVRVYYDPSSGTLAAANGTAAVQSVSDLDEADIEAIVIPAGTYPVGAVALSYGQTDFDTATQVRFAPARYFLSPEGHLLTGDAVTRTIASGVITVGTESIVVAAAESGTTDDLDTLTVSGTPRMGWIVADTGDTITIKHGVDNISCFGAADVDVTDASAAVWMYDGTTVFVAGGGGGDAIAVDYTPTTSGDWTEGAPDDVGEALDTLAARGLAAAAKTRLVASKLYDSTLGSTDRFDVPNASLSAGIYADYDRIDLWVINARSSQSATSDVIYILFNGDTTAANYSFAQNYGGSTNGGSRGDLPSIAEMPGASSPANYVADIEISVFGLGSSSNKMANSISGQRRDATTQYSDFLSVQWENTAAITQITLQPNGYATDGFVAGTRLIIVGYKEETIGGIAYSTADVGNPPTDAELDSAFGAPATLPVPFAAIVNDNNADTAMWLVASNGTSWWYSSMTKAT